MLSLSFPSKKHLLYNKFCIFATEYINNNLFHCTDEWFKIFSFTRFINISPQELHNIVLGEWVFV